MASRASVTIEHVAKAAGVSRQTVSRVINKGPNVKPAVRERVEAAIAALGYVPNLSARRMGGGKSFLILAVNDRQRTIENWRAGRGNDWVDQMLHGGITECEKHGYHLIFELIDTDPAAAPRQLSNAIAALRPDGVILTPPHSDNEELPALLADRGIPCARIGRRPGTQFIDVFMDEEEAAAEITARLIALGHTRLAFVAGSPEYGNSTKRLAGFARALAASGLGEAAGSVAKGNFRFDDAAREIERLLTHADPPTALIAENDEMAFAAMHVADRLGLAVPQQLSIASFEDTPGVRFSVPPLTAIRQPTAEMIAAACAQLIAASAGGPAHGRIKLPYRLVERATTGPAPALSPRKTG